MQHVFCPEKLWCSSVSLVWLPVGFSIATGAPFFFFGSETIFSASWIEIESLSASSTFTPTTWAKCEDQFDMAYCASISSFNCSGNHHSWSSWWIHKIASSPSAPIVSTQKSPAPALVTKSENDLCMQGTVCNLWTKCSMPAGSPLPEFCRFSKPSRSAMQSGLCCTKMAPIIHWNHWNAHRSVLRW